MTLSSGIMAALPGLLHNPSSVPTLLAQQLPQSSTFFLTYVYCPLCIYIYLTLNFFQIHHPSRSVWNGRRLPPGHPAGYLLRQALHPWKHSPLRIRYQVWASERRLGNYFPWNHAPRRHHTRLLHNFSDYQRSCLRDILPVLPPIQVSVLVGI